MLRALVRQAGTGVLVTAGWPTPDVPRLIQDPAPAALLIAAVGPGGLTEARYVCRRLRDQHPGAKIVVGRWGRGKDPKRAQSLLLSAGADRVAATLREARAHLARLLQPVPPAPDLAPQAG
jgi:hypothetical protein